MADFGDPSTWEMNVDQFIDSGLPKEKPQELLDLQEQNRKQRLLQSLQKIGGGLEDSSLDFIRRDQLAFGSRDKAKRGLVDEPGSYAGEQAKGIYTLNELANLETNPYGPDAFKSFVRGGGNKSKENIKKFLEMLKESGAEMLPRNKQYGDYNFKIKNIDKVMKGVTKFALAGPKTKPQKFTQRYYEEVPKVFNELVKKGEPFSKMDLKRKVLLNLKDFPYQMKDTALDDVITKTISKKKQKKFTYGGDLKSLQVTKGKQDIYENVLKGTTKFKDLIKATGQTEKELERNIKNLMSSLYETRSAIGAKEDLSNIDRKNRINVFLRNENLDNIDKAINNIIDEPTLKTSYRETFNNMVYDAIGNPENKKTYQPKKYERMMKRLRAFYSLNDELRKKFPQFDLRLDHGLSRAAIKTVLGEGDKTKFLNVAPLSEELNAGLKKAFDVQYKTILENIQDDSKRADRTKFLKQKLALEKLSKNLELPFGTISPGGQKKFTSGTLLEQDLPENIKKAITIKNKIIEKMKKIPNLQKQFDLAFEGTKTSAFETLNNLKKDKNIPKVLNFINAIIRKRPDLLANEEGQDLKRYVSANNIMTDATYVDDETESFVEGAQGAEETKNVLPSYSEAAGLTTGAAIGSKATKADPLKGLRRFGKEKAKNFLKGIAKVAGAPIIATGLTASEIFEDINPIRFAKEDEDGLFKYDEKFGTLKEDPNIKTAGSFLLGPELAALGSKALASKGAKGILSRAASILMNPFGKAARAFTPVGLATIAGGAGYDVYKEIERRQELTDEERLQEDIEAQAKDDEMMVGAAEGGRIGFADGPDDPNNPGRRKFMKLAAGLASIPILGKFFKVAEKAAPLVQQIKNSSTAMPDWFPNFVDKFISRSIGKKIDADFMEYKNPDLPNIKLSKSDDGKILVEGRNEHDQAYNISYEPPGYEVLDYKTGKSVKTKGEFEAVEGRHVALGPEDYDTDPFYADDLDDLFTSDVADMEKYATGNVSKTVKDAFGKETGLKKGKYDVDMAQGQAENRADILRDEGLDEID